MTTAAPTPVEVTETDFMLREINRGLFVHWVNADLINRAGCDVRSSIVLYDADGGFMHAFPACFEFRPGTEQDVWEALYEAGVRTWSRGIV